MESDSPLPALSLAITFACFFIAAAAEASVSSTRLDRVRGLVSRGVRGSNSLQLLHEGPDGPTRSFAPLKYALASASLLSAAALGLGLWDSNWWLASLTVFGTLAALGVAQVVAGPLGTALGERAAVRIAGPIRGLALLLSPLFALERTTNRRLNGLAKVELDEPDNLAPDLNISVGAQGEPLDDHEVEMIRGVVELDQTTAREIMVPRGDMVAAERSASLAQLADRMMESGHSRIPVYDGDLDHVHGIVHARDIVGILSAKDGTIETLTDEAIRPALFIPETKTLEELLNEFQELQVHIAIVIDEYGGVAGLVTIEDLLEEIVGEINDEFDMEEPEVVRVDGDQLLMDARVTLDDLNELLDVTVEGNGFDTVGGFVYHRLGKIPSPGDTVEYDGLTIRVVSTVGRRLKKLLVTRKADEPPDEPSR